MDVLAVDLCNGPLDHGAAGERSPVDLLEVVVWVAQVLRLHQLADVITERQVWTFSSEYKYVCLFI